MNGEDMHTQEHTITMIQRKKLSITGVTDVLRFDEQTVAVDTHCGLLMIKGEQLHVGNLNLKNGEISIDGQIDDFCYAEQAQPQKSSFFSRLLR